MKELRLAARLSQTELARAANVSQTLISAVERGGIQLTIPKVQRIAAALNCTVDDLLREESA